MRANFFFLNVSPGLSDLYHYDVEITPERCPRSVKRDVVNEIINKYKKTTFQGHHPAFDGAKNLYSRIKLPVPVSFFNNSSSNCVIINSFAEENLGEVTLLLVARISGF